MRRSLSRLQAFLLSFLTSGFLTYTSQVRAQEVWEENRCVIGEVATIQGFECILERVLNIAVSFIGLGSFIMFIIGSFLFLTSGGSPKGAEAGKNTMTYAIVGILVALGAAFFLRFVAGFTGVTGILNFNLFLE